MKRLIMIICLAIAAFAPVMAQSGMTDEQIVEYVKTRNKAGADQQTIARELLARGVSKQQLLALRDKMAASQAGDGDEASDAKPKPTGARKNNGETVDETPAVSADDMLLPPRKIFGHDIFRSKQLSFEPNMNIVTPGNYVLGPGDEVTIDVFGVSQTSTTAKITPDGTVNFPKIGPIGLTGMTVDQATAKVKNTIGRHYQNSSIRLTVGQTRTVIVNIMGEVRTPGTYTVSAFTNVFNALYLAGGITDIGTLRKIKVSRGGKIVSTIDVYDFIINGQLKGNIQLQDNDVIIVGPYENLVDIRNGVKRPMMYEVKDGETLAAVIKYAGGFSSEANTGKIRVERLSADGMSVHTVSSSEMAKFALADGDIIRTDTTIGRYRNTVMISGAVFYPGKYQLGQHTNTVQGLISQAGGLMESAFSNRAVLHRRKQDRTFKAMTIDLDGIIKGDVADIALVNEDSLVIGSREKSLYNRNVSIYGEVNYQGEYVYSDGETIEDLIVEAGGLKDAASLMNIEVARNKLYLPKGEELNDENASSKIYTLTLKDGLIIGSDTGFKLMPFDLVTVHHTPLQDEIRTVYVTGEARYAGVYALGDKNERVSSLIKRAGGLTQMASMDDAVIVRKLTDEERSRKELLAEMSTYGTDSINVRKIEISDTYSVSFNLKAAMENPGGPDDVVLRNGDDIRIPKYNNTVTVNGEVLNPNSIRYVEGKTAKYYIDLAGGYSAKAYKSKTYVIYPNGQAKKGRKAIVKPGSEIVVPTVPEKKADAQKVSLWIAASSAMATIGAILISALK